MQSQVEVDGLIPVWDRLSIVAEHTKAQPRVWDRAFPAGTHEQPQAAALSQGWSLWCEEEGKLLTPHGPGTFLVLALVVTYDNELMAS